MSFFEELKRRNVIRVAVAYLAVTWLLTEVASTVFPLFGVPDWGTRFVVIILALGFVPTLVFSWAYELTPEGLKKEKDVVREKSITHLTARRLDSITIAVVILVLAVFVVDHFWLDARMGQQSATNQATEPDRFSTVDPAAPEYPPRSIAVLPFVNMSDDPANEYFSDGISEELLNLLATIPELRVTARTSSFFFKGKDVTIADIARELQVANVLEGSVRKAGNRVRVTAQLIEAGSGTHLWSHTYDRTLEDIFAIQDEIAGEVVKSLKVTLLGEAAPKMRETDPEAFSLYLQCRHFSVGTSDDLRKGERYCRQALDIDPEYAPAWERLGTVYTNMAIRGLIDFSTGYEQATEFTKRALELAPNSAVVHAALGWKEMMYERDLPMAASHFRTALELAPSDYSVLGRAAVFAETLGRFDQAIELSNKALAVNPLGHSVYGNVAIVHCYVGQFERANERFAKALDLRPGQGGNPWRALCWLLQKEPEKALEEAERIELEVRRLWILPLAYYDLGQHDAADRTLKELIEKYPDEAATFIAENYAWRGEVDPAFEWLDRAIDEKQYMWGSLVFDPAFSKLHGDPRWLKIRTRVGRSEEQLGEIEF